MWQWPAFEQLLKQGCRTVAFHQASFGTPYAKPTRLFLRTPCELPSFVHEGAPAFDENGSYLGPLPSGKQYGGLFQHRAKGLFATSGSERWPPRLCQWLAGVLVETCLDPASTATQGRSTNSTTERTSATPSTSPRVPESLGGWPPPAAVSNWTIVTVEASACRDAGNLKQVPGLGAVLGLATREDPRPGVGRAGAGTRSLSDGSWRGARLFPR